MSRRKYTSKLKTKVVLEALKEKSSLVELAQKLDCIVSRLADGSESLSIVLKLY